MLSTAVVERDAAHSKMLELQAAVGAATEERRGLLERCLAAEAETERSRNLTVELRRKMEDSQAALHELGRENQSLQVFNISDLDVVIYILNNSVIVFYNIFVMLAIGTGKVFPNIPQIISNKIIKL